MTSHLRWIPLAVLMVLAPGHSRASAHLDDALRDHLRASAPEEMVPVMVVMEEQGLSVPVRARLRTLSAAGRRREGHLRLRLLAQSSQTDLRVLLEDLAAAGAADSIRSLFMVNAVLARVRADRVFDLLLPPGVRAVLWDPPVPEEEMNDRGPEPRGARSGDGNQGARLDPVIPWNLQKVKAPEAWNLGYTGAGVLVAIIDSGLDYNHPDLANHIYANPGEIPDNGLDDEGNGFVDDVRGWDFVFGDNDPMGDTPTDHGTLVAGIVAGDGTSGTRTGVAPGATLLPVKASGGSWGTLFQGLDYAVLMGADIIQMSITQKWRFSPKPDFAAWRTIMENELALGLVHANSIGNEGNRQDTQPIPVNIQAPGNCPPPWSHPNQYLSGGSTSIIAVGAVRQDDYADDDSSRGPSIWEEMSDLFPSYPWIIPPEYRDYPYSTGEGGLIKPDLCAPGPNTTSTKLGGGYLGFSGTSAATPHVAGALAMLLQVDPDLAPEDLDMILETTAVDRGAAGKDNIYGAGLLDCQAAVLKAINLASYGTVRGTVRDALTDAEIPGATVVLSLPVSAMTTNQTGRYAVNRIAGPCVATVSRFGYRADTSAVVVQGGGDQLHDVWLLPLPQVTVAGTVTSAFGASIPGVRVAVQGAPLPPDTTDSDGAYLLAGVPVGATLILEAVRFGYVPMTATVEPVSETPDTVHFILDPGVQDNFEFDQGWNRGSNDTAVTGRWERADPNGTWTVGGSPVQPDSDFTAAGTICALTQNGNPGAGVDLTDVDGGKTTLLSPVFDGTIYTSPVLKYRRWYVNNAGGAVDDVFRADVSSDGGSTWVNLETVATASASWTLRSFSLSTSVSMTTSMRIRFEASDTGQGSVVEAAIDEVEITGATSDAADDAAGGPNGRWSLRLFGNAPNPFDATTTIRYEVPARQQVRLAVYRVDGRRVRTLVDGVRDPGPHAAAWDGSDDRGRRCAAGLYLYRLEQGSGARTGRMVVLR